MTPLTLPAPMRTRVRSAWVSSPQAETVRIWARVDLGGGASLSK